jgi:D-galactose 1-dehydrogenase
MSRPPIRIGLVGLGKIARDQHLPTLAASPDFAPVAGADPHAALGGLRCHPSLDAMLAAEPTLDAVALCQPPQARFAAAMAAIAAGRHVLLEKPPGATLSEVKALADAARARGVTLFAAWHSRFAAGVAPARAWLAGRTIRAVRIDWREDVRVWHPGQRWIWEAGGMGVFDPGINALSIATAILPPFRLLDGRLDMPANCQSPIAADLRFATVDGAPVQVGLDFLQTGPQTWDIAVDTDDGTLLLSKGGAELSIDGVPQHHASVGEYHGIYDRFAALVRARESEVDVSPLRHVADAFLRAERREVAAFVE